MWLKIMEDLKNIDAIGLVVTITISLAGMFIHYLKKWLRGETKDSLFNYIFGKKSWKHTVNTVLTVVATIGTMFASGQLDYNTLSGLIAITSIGYACDSIVNKDSDQATKK
jgi:small-conductance mechanosensitive channel